MKILFLTTAHNSLSQRLFIELTELGHIVDVALAISELAMLDAVGQHAPDLIIAPMLKRKIPEAIWSKHVCLIVHPGVKGDRGASSLDWAIMTRQTIWGVTVLQAAAEMDAGAIWASYNFALSGSSIAKSSVYRRQVTEAAVRGVLEAVEKFQLRQFRPEALDYNSADVIGCWRPTMRQSDRAIDWSRDSTKEIAAKISAADSTPGVLDTLLGRTCFLYGAHVEDRLKGPTGEIIAQRDGAICIGTIDGAVWISHLGAKGQGAPQESEYRVVYPNVDCGPCNSNSLLPAWDQVASDAGVGLAVARGARSTSCDRRPYRPPHIPRDCV